MPTSTTPPRTSGTMVIACLALLLSGIAVGVLMGRWTRTPVPNSQPGPQATREAATSNSDEIGRLTAAVQQLTDVLQKPGAALALRGNELEKWKGPGFASLDALFQQVEAASPTTGDWRPAPEELRKDHLAWTREDVFERYGPPSSMGAREGGGLGLAYMRERPQGPSEGVIFTSVEGFITDLVIK